MFCSRVLRIHRLNNLFSNSRKLHLINAKYLSHLFNINRNIDKNISSSDYSLIKRSIHKKNRFLDDVEFRREILENVFILSQNISKSNRSLNELVEENDLQVMSEIIGNNGRHLKNKELFTSLHSLLNIGLDPNSKAIRSLENEVIWRCKGMPLKQILECLSFHIRYQSTELQKKAINELIINLVLKLDNTANDNELVQLLSLWKALGPEVIEKIEMSVIDMIGSNDNSFKVESLSYILVLLSQMNRRTKPLIKAVVNKFTYSSIDLKDCKETHIIKMISSVNKLNYSDINFLRKASDFLCTKKFLNTVPPSDRRDLLVAVSQMRWSYHRLLDQYVEKILDTNNDFSSQDFLVLISSFARLYYRSDYLNDILSSYVTSIIKREDFNCESWLLYVWSLSILGCVPLNCIHSVLNEDFYRELMSETAQPSDESPNFRQIMAKLKLFNIKCVSELEFNEKIDSKLFSQIKWESTKREASIEKFKKSIQQNLNAFVENVSTNVFTPFGFTIDAEFIINKELDSLLLTEFGSLGVSPYDELPSLPDGYKRCAVLCLGFNDTLLNESGFIGIHELSIRLLKRLGYYVIPMTETSFPVYLKGSQKSEKLKSFLNNVFE